MNEGENASNLRYQSQKLLNYSKFITFDYFIISITK